MRGTAISALGQFTPSTGIFIPYLPESILSQFGSENQNTSDQMVIRVLGFHFLKWMYPHGLQGYHSPRTIGNGTSNEVFLFSLKSQTVGTFQTTGVDRLNQEIYELYSINDNRKGDNLNGRPNNNRI